MGELIFIGLGLYDERDISLKGKKAAVKADSIFTEFYTSNLTGCELEDVEGKLEIEIKTLSRAEIEEEEVPLKRAEKEIVAFMTAGDPMAATTHVDLRLRAEEKGIRTRVIHSSSIFSAAPSILGVQHYKFGKTITLPFSDDREYPKSPYEGIRENKKRGLHSLVLLDINGEEEEYMDVQEGIDILLELEDSIGDGLFIDDTLIAGLARVGSDDPKIAAGYPEGIKKKDFGDGLHCLVVFGELHFMEIDALLEFADAPEDIRKR